MQPSDNELLGKFVRNNDEQSILQIIQRHSPMVMGVCQSLLWHHQDAEDAFQATFLVLANKAPKLLKHSSIAGWLYEVAGRNCRNLIRQKKRKREVELSQEPYVNSNEPWKSISQLHDREIVQRELAKLPSRYRDVIVLCHVNGLSRAEAADRLDCTTAAVKASLARGRKLLRQRLVRHGIVASSVIGVLAAATTSASETLPPDLVSATARMCQRLTPEPGFGSSPETIQSLAHKELVGMNFVHLSKIGLYCVLGISLLSLPIVLYAQNNPTPTTVSASLELDSASEGNSKEFTPVAIREPEANPPSVTQPQDNEGNSAGNPPAKIDSAEQLLLNAVKDSTEYWSLMLAAAESRSKDLDARMQQIQRGDSGDLTKYELHARILEERAKILQIQLLLKDLKSRKDSDNAAANTGPSNRAKSIPRSASDPFQPGEVITIESQSSPSIKRRIFVATDSTITLPLIGVISVEGKNQRQLRKTLEVAYEEFISKPMIDVYRGELPAATGKNIPRSSTAEVEAGEILAMTSLSTPSLNRWVTIQADCTVTVPLVGPINGKGLTPNQLSDKLNVAMKQYIRDPDIAMFRGAIDDPKEENSNQ